MPCCPCRSDGSCIRCACVQAGRACGHDDCYPSRRSRCQNQLESQRAASTGRTRNSHQPAHSSSQPTISNRGLLTRPPEVSHSQPVVTSSAALRGMTPSATAQAERERLESTAETLSESPTSFFLPNRQYHCLWRVLPSIVTSEARHFRVLPPTRRAQELVRTL